MNTSGMNSQQVRSNGKKKLNWLTIEPHITASGLLAEWFEVETGIGMTIHPVPYADITNVAVSDASGDSSKYDIVQYWYPMLGSLAQKKALLDISDWWSKQSREIKAVDLIPIFWDGWCLVGQKRYGIPYDGDMHLLFYNKPLFERHGLKPPKTWDDYLEISKKITEAEKENGNYGCGIMAADIPLILIGTFLNRLAGFGGEFFDNQGKPTVNSPAAVAALEHLVAEIPYALPSPTDVAFDEILEPWILGKVGMVEFWADLGKISDSPGQPISNNWGVTTLPKGPAPKGKIAAPLNAGWGLGISPKTRQPELARKFLEFCIRSDISLCICTVGGGLDPTLWSIYENAEFRRFVTEDLTTAAKTAIISAPVSWPTDVRWPELQQILHDNLYLAAKGDCSPQKALDDTQSAWIELIK